MAEGRGTEERAAHQADPALAPRRDLVADASLQVGVDLISVTAVAHSLAMFGDRYRHRLFTERELADTAGPSEAAGLAARFAAKEAVLKALTPEDDAPPWRSIEVRRTTGGRPALLLHDEASALAARRGLNHWAVSLTHEGPMAAAVVIAGRRMATTEEMSHG